MQFRIIYNDFFLGFCFVLFFFPNLVISGFLKGARLTFLCVLYISGFLTVWGATRPFSAFSTEISVAQINYVCLVSIAFTFCPSSYTSLMLGTSLATVSSGNRGKENTWKVYFVPVW